MIVLITWRLIQENYLGVQVGDLGRETCQLDAWSVEIKLTFGGWFCLWNL